MLRLVDETKAAGVDWIDVRRDVMDEYNTGLQEELNSVEVWQVGASDYYRTAAGQNRDAVAALLRGLQGTGRCRRSFVL